MEGLEHEALRHVAVRLEGVRPPAGDVRVLVTGRAGEVERQTPVEELRRRVGGGGQRRGEGEGQRYYVKYLAQPARLVFIPWGRRRRYFEGPHLERKHVLCGRSAGANNYNPHKKYSQPP